MENLQALDSVTRCWESALNLLSYRMRSQKELMVRLQQKGYSQEHIEETIEKLKSQKLINDSQFAAAWSRHYCDKSQRMLKHEFYAKGISDEDISSIEMEDDWQKAESLVLRKMHTLAADPHKKRKIYGYLQRRGFDNDIIMAMLRRFFPDG
jgi:regulatory protein